jgi:hypothetical protein
VKDEIRLPPQPSCDEREKATPSVSVGVRECLCQWLHRRKRIPPKNRKLGKQQEAVPEIQAPFALSASQERPQQRIDHFLSRPRNIHLVSFAVRTNEAFHFFDLLRHE